MNCKNKKELLWLVEYRYRRERERNTDWPNISSAGEGGPGGRATDAERRIREVNAIRRFHQLCQSSPVTHTVIENSAVVIKAIDSPNLFETVIEHSIAGAGAIMSVTAEGSKGWGWGVDKWMEQVFIEVEPSDQQVAASL